CAGPELLRRDVPSHRAAGARRMPRRASSVGSLAAPRRPPRTPTCGANSTGFGEVRQFAAGPRQTAILPARTVSTTRPPNSVATGRKASMSRFLFPRWANKVLPLGVVFGLGPLGTAVVAGFWYYGTQKHFEVGYRPVQPVAFSHKLHAGDMGMDCRYCHSTVERSGHAAVPPTQTCMNCHTKVRPESPKLAAVRESWEQDVPVEWVKVHNLPDYVYFDH